MKLPATALIACALAGSTGCSLIGLGLGARADKKRMSTPSPASPWEVHELKPGARLVLQLRDGERVAGPYDGLELRSQEEYAPAYAAACAARPEGFDLPELGPGVWLNPAGETREVELVGLDLRGVVLRRGGDVAPVPFSRVVGLRDPSGRAASGEVLQRLVRAHRLPTLSVVRLREPQRRVPADDVQQVEVYSDSGSRKLQGFFIGLAVDLVVAVMVSKGLEGSSRSACRADDPYCASCPFVFGFDGTAWRREAELLGAATLESAQLSDRARLEHVAPSGGRYRIRLVNEMEEVDHLDAVRLLVVDLPEGARAVPDPEGRLLAVVDPQPPGRAADLEGRVLTQALAASDGQVWLGSPLGRDPRQPGDRWDGVLLEFERPAGADAVTLVFDARSSLWGVQMLVELLSLHGADLEAWRARVNADPEAREAFLGALAREGLPRIRVWDGREWRLVGTLRNLGPALAREQALRVPLDDVPGTVLRVRVDATPGFWVLDSVAADFAEPPPVWVEALEADSATLAGRDVSGLLASGDGRRLTLHRGEGVELAFRVPDGPAAGNTRSILAEATGYYTPLIQARGAADAALFEYLVAEPGAFARHNLERLEEEIARATADARGAPIR